MMTVAQGNKEASAQALPIDPWTAHSLADAWKEPRVRDRLRQFICNGILKELPEVSVEFLDLLSVGEMMSLSDDQLCDQLRKILPDNFLQKSRGSAFTADEERRIQRRVGQLTKLLEDRKIETLLDVGCGTGDIGVRLGNALGTSTVIGADVTNRVGDPSKMKYVEVGSDNTIGLPDSSADAALFLMTLHHEENPLALLTEAARVLRPGGVIVIRDHDASSRDDQLFCAAIDLLYFEVFNQASGVDHAAYYRSAYSWCLELERAGFTTERFEYPEPGSPMKPFHLIAKKN